VSRTIRPLTFHGKRSTTIAAGAAAASDGTPFPVSPLDSLTVTLYLAGATGPATFHEDGLTTTYRAAGDHRFDAAAPAFAGDTSHSFYYLAGVDVSGGPPRRPPVALLASLTPRHNTARGRA